MGQFIGHPFIVSLHFAFQTEKKLFFVLDYLPGGSLWFALRENCGPFSEEVVKFYAAEILLALAALHSMNVVYRDLKLENILLDSEGHLVLTDFGLSARMKPNKRIVSYSGSPAYLAPEILSDTGREGHGKSVDLWSLGVLLHVMLTLKTPFWSDDIRDLFVQIRSSPIDLSPFESALSKEAMALLRGLLERDVAKRLGCGGEGIAELFDHPFFAGVDWDLVLGKGLLPPIKPESEAEIQSDHELGIAISESLSSEQIAAVAQLGAPKRGPGKGRNADKNFKRFTFRPVGTLAPPSDPASSSSSSLSASSSSSNLSADGKPRPALLRQWTVEDIKVQSGKQKQKAIDALTKLHNKKSRRGAIRLDAPIT